MNRARNRFRPFGLAGTAALALFVVWGADASHAEAPGDSAATVLVALAPDSTAAPSGPSPAASDHAPSSSLTEDGGGVASTPGPAAGAVGEPAAGMTAAPKGESPAPTHLENDAAKTGRADPAKRPKRPSAGKPNPAARPAAADANATAGPAASDPNRPDEGAHARQELERTEPILRAVKAKVVRSFNKKAREEFEIATARQREAREALGQNLFARAERLTLEARSLAREIAVHLGPPEDDADYVSMALDRTDDALGRAREVLRDAGNASGRRRLAALEGRQKEARRLHKDGSTRRAFALTREVRDGVLSLLRDCDDLPVPEATAEKALKRASRSLEQAKGELGERLTASAARLAREARAQMAKARAAFARKNYRDTLLHSKLVERNLELAVSAQRSSTNHSG